MKLSHLKQVFSNDTSIVDFKNAIQHEVEDYSRLASKKGSSIPIIVTEDTELYVESKDIIKLLLAYIDGAFVEDEVYYIVDGLTMAEKVHFESGKLFDIATTLTDPEINGRLTIDSAAKVLNSFK